MSADRDRRAQRSVFTAILLGLVALQAYLTWPVPSTSYLLPAFILAPTAALLMIQLAKELWGGSSGRLKGTSPANLDAVTWMLLMPALLVLLGLVIAAAVYTLLYLRWRADESLSLAGIAAVIVGIALSALAWSLNKPQLFAGPLW